MAANLAAQLDALNDLYLAYQAAHADFTTPLLRIGFGNPSMPYEDLPGPPSACVWPPAGIDEREINCRLLAAQRFLKERGDLPLCIIRDIGKAQIGLTASEFDEAQSRSLIILNPLDEIRGALRGYPGASVTGILSTIAAENAALESVLKQISVELVILKGKIAAAASGSKSADSPGATGNLIERLRAGPDNVQLSREDYAFLKAFLAQPGNRTCFSELAGRGPDINAKLRLILAFNRNLQATSAPTTAKSDVAETNSKHKRWVWDLYPLAKDSWGAWELEDDEQRPDHRVYMRRRKGKGYLEPPAGRDLIFRLMERGVQSDDFAVHEGYVPNTDDVALLRRVYPDADPYRPAWYTIKADLVATGEDADRMDKSEAPVLLSLLRKAKESAIGGTTNQANASPSISPTAEVEQTELAPSFEIKSIATDAKETCDKMPKHNQVFISYSHKDEKYLKELLTHLKPLERAGRVTSWSDQQINPSLKWFPEIKKALALSKVAILLVTSNFLASDFIYEHELTPILKEAEVGGMKILWILVRACNYKETPIAIYQAVIPPDKPLAKMGTADRDTAWVKICEGIKKAANP